MKKDNFSIEITKKDKMYLSIILSMLCIIVVLAICLPRPYKFVDKEVVVEKPVYVEVYETKKWFVISPSSNLYSAGGYTDLEGNLYTENTEETLVDTGSFKTMKASISVNDNGTWSKKEIDLTGAISNLTVESDGLVYRVKIDSFIMANIKTLFQLNVGEEKVNIVSDYLLEFSFEKAKVNILVSFISE